MIFAFEKPVIRKCFVLAWTLLFALNVGATTITLDITDGAGEGFNDPGVVSPVGGNNGTTLGDQRRIVFEYAAEVIASIIDTPATIVVQAAFNPLSCTASSATLGQAGLGGVLANSCGAPLSNTWYPTALANAVNGQSLACDDFGDTWPNEDLRPFNPDVIITFNSSIDNNNNCLQNRSFYYGLDGAAGADIDLFSTVLHEIIHGLGFVTIVDLTDGSISNNFDDVYMRNLEDASLADTWGSPTFSNAERAASAIDDGDLLWVGSSVTAEAGALSAGVTQGHAQMYAPTTLALSSSVSHFDTELSPNELMEPVATGPKESIGLARPLLEDIGWTVFSLSQPAVSSIEPLTMSSLSGGAVSIALFDDDSSLAAINLSAASSNVAIVPASGLVLSGSGRLRTLTITPIAGSSGTTTITVTANDGSELAQSQFLLTVFTPDQPPVVEISAPDDGTVFYSGPQTLTASAIDNEDGDLSSSLNWMSSLQGALGTGAALSPSLNDGSHILTASVTDSGNNVVSDAVTIQVDLAGDADSDGLINSVEVLLGTNPELGDSDNDGVSDFDEVNRDGNPGSFTAGIDTDPLDPDTDDDGVNDGADPAPLDPAVSNSVTVWIPVWALTVIAGLLVLLAAPRRFRSV